ncbi:MAG TPA: isocitrate/isopropylmalate family dehydrogenase, partial [Chloroflexota bacterium]
GAKEWREGEELNEEAFRTERITRRTCRAVTEYAFLQAERVGARVFGGPKYTVSRIYEGMFKEEMDAAARRHPNVRYEPQLIDATFALLLTTTGDPLVIPSLNRDGDILSDLVLQLFGSIAGAESLLLSFDDQFHTKVVMAEAPHGTAPRLFGKNLANPMAMILAAGSMLGHFDDEAAHRTSQAIHDATFHVVYEGIRTVDLGGQATTTEFTDAVIERLRDNRTALRTA